MEGLEFAAAVSQVERVGRKNRRSAKTVAFVL